MWWDSQQELFFKSQLFHSCVWILRYSMYWRWLQRGPAGVHIRPQGARALPKFEVRPAIGLQLVVKIRMPVISPCSYTNFSGGWYLLICCCFNSNFLLVQSVALLLKFQLFHTFCWFNAFFCWLTPFLLGQSIFLLVNPPHFWSIDQLRNGQETETPDVVKARKRSAIISILLAWGPDPDAMGVPQNGWFRMEKSPILSGWFGEVPLFEETSNSSPTWMVANLVDLGWNH